MKHLLLIFSALVLFSCSKDTVKPTKNENIQGIWIGYTAKSQKVSCIFNPDQKGHIEVFARDGSRDDVVSPEQADFTYFFNGSEIDTKGSDLAGTYLDGKASLDGNTLTIHSSAGFLALKKSN